MKSSGRVDSGSIAIDYFRYYSKDYGLSLPSTAILVREGGPGHSLGGNWAVTQDVRGYQDYSTRFSTDSGAWGQWVPNLPKAGFYQVWIWNPADYMAFRKERTDKPGTFEQYAYQAPVHIRVESEGGSKDSVVNQLTEGNRWVDLGKFEFSSGEKGKVTLTVGKTMTRIDAVAFVPAGATSLPSGAGLPRIDHAAGEKPGFDALGKRSNLKQYGHPHVVLRRTD